MVRRSRALLLCLMAMACFVAQRAFIPGGPLQKRAAMAGASVGILSAAPAYADKIGDAAKELGEATYPFVKQVDWNNGLYLQAPGEFKPLQALKAIDKMIVMGSQADPKLLKAAAEAHHTAITKIKGPNGVTSSDAWDGVNAALGRVFASVPESTVMDVYNAVSDITDSKVPQYLRSLVDKDAADKAYEGFLKFKDVVKENQVSEPGPAAVVRSGDKIGAAAAKLSSAAYPLLKDVDWLSDLYIKPLPGASASQVLTAVDKTIQMGAAMDGNLLKAAAEAHHKAIGSIDAKGVTSADAFAEVNAALGRAVASVPTQKVMDVYLNWAAATNGVVTNKLFSTVDPLHANAAAKAFYEFKDVVKASQR